jgi:hypothetical protein
VRAENSIRGLNQPGGEGPPARSRASSCENAGTIGLYTLQLSYVGDDPILSRLRPAAQ